LAIIRGVRREERASFAVYARTVRTPSPAPIFSNLFETLEILDLAITSRDKEKAFEAVTILLLQVMSTFGRDSETHVLLFPALEQIKDDIEAENFARATAYVVGIQALLRTWARK
jgi:hypothetical protein